MNKKIIAFGALVLAVVITSFSVSGTYAKYTSEFEASSTVKVAKWDFQVDKNSVGAEATKKEMTFDLLKEHTNSSLIDQENNEKLIAPGSTGSVEIELKNSSDVKAKVKLAFEGTDSEKNIPLKFKISSGSDITAEDDYKLLSELTSGISAAELSFATKDETKKVRIEWEWDPSNGDTEDTKLGIDSVDEYLSYILKVTITAEQDLGA